MWVIKGPSHLMFDLHCRNQAEKNAIADGSKDEKDDGG